MLVPCIWCERLEVFVYFQVFEVDSLRWDTQPVGRCDAQFIERQAMYGMDMAGTEPGVSVIRGTRGVRHGNRCVCYISGVAR